MPGGKKDSTTEQTHDTQKIDVVIKDTLSYLENVAAEFPKSDVLGSTGD